MDEIWHHRTLRIATRRSKLALWQAEHVKSQLLGVYPELHVELLEVTTRGDILLDTPLARVGGKGLFIKELEAALRAQRADIAVHSMKDVPVELPPGLQITVVLPRADPRDAWVGTNGRTLDDLPAGAVVGTSSLRRRAQLLALRPEIEVQDLRGNVTTRLDKLKRGGYHGIVLASAGLNRLRLAHEISSHFALNVMTPAVGQGIIGIESRCDDSAITALLAPLDDGVTHVALDAERAVNKCLNGGCQAPIAAHATVHGAELEIAGLVASLDGRQLIKHHQRGPRAAATELGIELGRRLLADGADKILAALRSDE